MIEKLHEKLINKEVTIEELVQESLKKAHELQDECNAFVTIIDEPDMYEVNDNLLSGIPYGLKDNISTKDYLTTGSSNTLKNYVPVYDATSYKLLKESGAILIGKTVLDEFGMGGTGTTGHTGIVLNPWDKTRICGGSSAGSAASVAAHVYPYALGSDTGDSVRKPAAYCGIVGYKPTYGLISRYGLFPFASSLDHIGVLTTTVRDAAIVVDNIKGKDYHDMTSIDSSNINLLDNLDISLEGKKFFYIKSLVNKENYSNNEVLYKHIDNFFLKLELLKSKGAIVEGIDIDEYLLNSIPSVYTSISCGEATSNMSNLTGIIFGPRGKGDNINDMIKDHRTNGFSPLIKRRFVIGSYVLQKENQEKYFKNAMRIRRLIVDKMKELFKEYDALIMPVGSGIAPLVSEVSETLKRTETEVLDNLLQIGNFGGFPSITIPSGIINGMPVGINITCNNYLDELTLGLASSLESLIEFKGLGE